MSQVHTLNWHIGLRALACLSVIVYHLNQHRAIADLAAWNWSLYQFVGMLSIVVSLFFMLSAISNSTGFWRAILKDQPIPSVKKLFVDRFFRIAPAYYAALFGSFLLVLMVQGYDPSMIPRLLAGITFLSWVHPTTFFPVDINGPLWFIAYDMMGAILVFSTMYLFTRIRKSFIPLAFLGISGILLALHLWFTSLPFPAAEGVVSSWFPAYNPFIFGFHFLVGIAVSWVFVWQEKRGRKISIVYDGFFLFLSAWLISALWMIREAGDFDYSLFHSAYRFPYATIPIALILLVSPSTRYIGKWLDNRFFHGIARLSYSVYLWHAIVIVLMTRYVFDNVQNLLMPEWMLLVVVTLIVSFFIAWLSYRYIEVPVSNWWRDRGNKALR